MQVDEGRIRFRNRTYWEATDLGARLIAERPFYYAALSFCTILPVYLLLTLVFWQSPFWVMVILWWLKPMFEGGILQVLSVQVFSPIPPFSGSLKQAWRLLFRRRIVGDLLWRRFSINRALLLPVTLLEQLSATEHPKRCASVSRYGNTQSAWLTIFGIHFESMLLYAFLIAMVWLLLGKDAGEVVLPVGSAWKDSGQQFLWLIQEEQSWIWHLENLLYLLVLTLWTPFYIAMGFSLYLQTRTVSEAWDIRLTFRRLNERIANPLLTIFAIILFSGSLLISSPTRAETLPNPTEVSQNVDDSIGKSPFIHLKDSTRYCWRECEKKPSHFDLPDINGINGNFAFLKLFYWLLACLLVIGVLYILYRLLPNHLRTRIKTEESLPETLFGLDVREQSLPNNIAEAARRLFEKDPRAALSLLYRGLLHHLFSHKILTVRHSATESDILRQIQTHQLPFYPFAEKLTHEWIYLAYAHRLPEKETVFALCDEYQRQLSPNPLDRGAP